MSREEGCPVCSEGDEHRPVAEHIERAAGDDRHRAWVEEHTDEGTVGEIWDVLRRHEGATDPPASRGPPDRESAAGGKRPTEWNDVWALAVVFGLASIPWTYAFVAGLHIPLWPSFIASATYYAVDEPGLEGLWLGYASNLAGIAYAAATLAVVDGVLGGGVVALSVVVGVFMFLASLHEFVPLLSFTPGAFFGYATMFSVHAAGETAFGVTGLGGETLAALAAMLIGALIGVATDRASGWLA